MGFEEEINEAVRRAVLKELSGGSWLRVEYGKCPTISGATLRKAYERIDMDNVIALVAEGLERKVADKILASLATELGNDVKSIMSNRELREDCRAVIRSKIRGL